MVYREYLTNVMHASKFHLVCFESMGPLLVENTHSLAAICSVLFVCVKMKHKYMHKY